MPAATLPILVNIFVAGMFVASFLTIAQLNPGFGHIRLIAVSYAAGLLTPIAEFILPLSPWPVPFMIVSYGGVLVGLVLMGPALSLLYGQRPAWLVAAAIAIGGLVLRGLIWGGQRNEFWYELAYQVPMAMAALFCSATIVAHGRKSGLDRIAAGLFAVIGAHFLMKPFAAVYFGSGATASDYVNSTYALISQASSGVLLIAAGLLVLINALQMVVLRDRSDAISDPLTGLPNRRALHTAFERMARGPGDVPAAIAILDIDHFKRVNDKWGHGNGDQVIGAVAQCLEENRPANAIVARVGGEEFVLLMPWQEEALARLACERLRLAVEQLTFTRVDKVTVSAGVTPVLRNEEMSIALGRADRGLYKAKEMGRNRCVFEPLDAFPGSAEIKLVG
jgi:diguanylate cyclase (GGDEF)-like protein